MSSLILLDGKMLDFKGGTMTLQIGLSACYIAPEQPAFLDMKFNYRICETIREAWRGCKSGGIGFELSHAVAGHSRLFPEPALITRL